MMMAFVYLVHYQRIYLHKYSKLKARNRPADKYIARRQKNADQGVSSYGTTGATIHIPFRLLTHDIIYY